MQTIENVLAIETSCDDTSVAIVHRSGRVLGLISANQDQYHKVFGGIVPEIASRNHTENLLPLIEQLLATSQKKWSNLGGIVVTNRPGLIGSLIVGVVTAKTLSQTLNLPLLGVNHLEGHILAPFLKDDSYQPTFSYDERFVALAVSGGHSSIYLVEKLFDYKIIGHTLDDAAGEAFDKFAKMLGLGFPGGQKVDNLSKGGDASKYSFPRSMMKEDNLLMSFSGLKSSAHRLLQQLGPEEIGKNINHLCASFQEAVTEVLISKLDQAVNKNKVKSVVITGGVSANSRLRELAKSWATKKSLHLMIPPIRYCTDNAAMIGLAGVLRLNNGERHKMQLGPSPSPWETDFRTEV